MNSRALWILIRLCRECGRSGCWVNDANYTYALHWAPSSRRGLVSVSNVLIISDKVNIPSPSLCMPNRPNKWVSSMVSPRGFLVSQSNIWCLQPTLLIFFNTTAKTYPIQSFQGQIRREPSTSLVLRRGCMKTEILYTFSSYEIQQPKQSENNLQRGEQWHFASK